MSINPQHFIEELCHDIKVKDPLKGRLVLSHLHEVDEKTQKRALFELSRAEVEFAILLLVDFLAAKPNLGPILQSVKEILYSKALDSSEVIIDRLANEVNKFRLVILAEIAGEIRLEAAPPLLLNILREEEDENVLKAAICALGMIGDASGIVPISDFLYVDSPDLINEAIGALGQFGTPTAIKRLSEKLGTNHDSDLLILDLFAKSQVPEALNIINEAISSHYAHIRNAAKQCLVKIGPKAVPILLGNLQHHDPDLLIHTLNVLGDIGDESAILPIRKLLSMEPKNANVRFAAYETLGKLPLDKGAFALAEGLYDPEYSVRAAAAKAVDHNYNMVLAAGLKNMIKDEVEETQLIIHTIIDSQCNRIFLDLVEEENFEESAIEYLSQGVHPDIRKHFAGLLTKNGHRKLARKIDKSDQPSQSTALKVFAVDDSKMILSVYRSVLHNLGCEARLFEFPVDALSEVQKEKPDVILTDLNMPDINGIELTKGVREHFNKEDLPIIMVTTQNDTQDNEAAYAAGINQIMHKPFNEETIGKALDVYLGS